MTKYSILSLFKEYGWLCLELAIIIMAPFTNGTIVFGALLIMMMRMLFSKDDNTILYDFIFLYSFSTIFVFPGGLGIFDVLIIVYVLYMLFVRSRALIPYLKPVCILLMIYISLRSDGVFNRLAPILSGILLTAFVVPNVTSQMAKKISILFCIGCAIMCIYSYFYRFDYHIIHYLGDDTQEFYFDTLRFGGLFKDPNYFASYVLVAISILLQLFYYKKINSFLFVSLLCILIYSGAASISKSFMISLIFSGSLFALGLLGSNSKKRGQTFYIAVLFTIFGIFVLPNITSFDLIVSRFESSSDMDAMTTGRSSLAQIYIEHILANPDVLFFGNSFSSKLINNIGTHNLYIEITYYVGVIGLFLITVFYSKAFLVIRRKFFNSFPNIIALLPILSLLFFYTSLQGLFSPTFSLLLLVSLISIINSSTQIEV